MWVEFKTEKFANWAGQSALEPVQHSELGAFDIDLYGLGQRETLSRAEIVAAGHSHRLAVRPSLPVSRREER